MKMRRGTAGIACCTDVPEQRFFCHVVTFGDVRCVGIQMSVVVRSSAGSNYRNRLPSQIIFANVDNVAFSG